MGERRVTVLIAAKDLASKDIRAVTSSFQAMLGPAAAAAAGLTTIAAASVKAFRAAAEQQRVERELGEALALTARNAGQSLDAMKEYASSLQATTKFGDEAILGAAKLLVSIGRLEGEGLKRATKAALDLAAGTGRDLTTAFNAVAKAAAGQTDSLGEFGIRIQKTGNAGRDFDSVLAKIEQSMGGLADATDETAEGALAQINNQLGDLWENLGQPFISSGFIEFLKEANRLLAGANSGIGGFAGGVANLLDVSGSVSSAKRGAFVDAFAPMAERQTAMTGGSLRGRGALGTVLVDTPERNRLDTSLLSLESRFRDAGVPLDELYRGATEYFSAVGVTIDSIDMFVAQVSGALVDRARTADTQRTEAAIAESEEVIARIREGVDKMTADFEAIQKKNAREGALRADMDFFQLGMADEAQAGVIGETIGGAATAANERIGESMADSIIAGANEKLQELGDKLIETAIQGPEAAGPEVKQLSESTQQWAAFTTQALSGIFSDMIRGTADFGDLLKNVLFSIIDQMIAQFVGSLVGSFFTGFLNAGGVVHAAAGLVPGAGPYVDHVPALLTPGERVLSRPEAERWAKSQRGSEAPSVGLAVSVYDERRMSRVIGREIRDAVRRRGYSVVASSVRGR